MIPASPQMEALAPEDFEFFRQRISGLAGIHLSDSKSILMQTRLRERLQELDLPSFADYRRFLERIPEDSPEWQAFINTLTTNKTDWFREAAHFDFLVDQIVPKRLLMSGDPFSAWSAACSTGQEVYTLAMLLEKALGDRRPFTVLGTDIDTEVLQRARAGIYPTAHLQDIPPEFHDTTFIRGTGEISHWMKVKPRLKSHAAFRQANLLEPGASPASAHDVIFCRNVLIYFSKQTIEQVVENLHDAAKPGGFLVIGHTESLQGIRTRWKMIRPSVFIRG